LDAVPAHATMGPAAQAEAPAVGAAAVIPPVAVEPAPPTLSMFGSGRAGAPVDTYPPRMERLAHALRGRLPREEWEAVIGANWLNKLGVLILVAGISLFIGYSLTQLGPAGRVAIGLGAGALLLAAGVVFERQARYVVFGRGLIGGGWAALYFTTYAMHGLDAARVIHSPWSATVLLLAVAACMIAHSLGYRAQTVTGVGYLVGFATLIIAPMSTFALAATVPLAASLVWVAHRFAWIPMAVLGLVTTYGVFAATVDPPAAFDIAQFAREQIVLALYWLMFEAFDVLSSRRGRGQQAAQFLFPLNTTAFLGVSLLRWSVVTPQTLYVFLAVSAVAYLASAVARALLPAQPTETGAVPAPWLGDRSYRASVTVAVVLASAGIFLRFDGLQITLGLLLVGQLLFFAGLRFADAWLRCLAGATLGIAVSKAAFADAWVPVHAAGGTSVLLWTPLAALTAAVLYMNRALLSARAAILPEQAYRAAASLLLVMAVGFEFPSERRPR
jgi:hypothetical protein